MSADDGDLTARAIAHVEFGSTAGGLVAFVLHSVDPQGLDPRVDCYALPPGGVDMLADSLMQTARAVRAKLS